MARTLDDYLARSKRANSAAVRRSRAVFDDAYLIAQQVISLREKRGLTQLELARITGISQSQISRIERGVVAPTTTSLVKIGKALGADVRLVEREHVVA